MRLFLGGAAAIAVAVAFTASAAAETRYVANDGIDEPGCLDVSSPCATIVYAVGQSAGGDTIRIRPGTYSEPATITAPHALTFIGAGSGTFAVGGTVVHGPDGSESAGKPAFELKRSATFRSIRVEGGDGENGTGTSEEHGGDGIRFVATEAGEFALNLEDAVVLAGNRAIGGIGTVGDPNAAVTVSSEPGGVSLSILDSVLLGGGSNGNAGAHNLRISGEGARAELVGSQLGGGVPNLVPSGLFLTAGAEAALRSTEVFGTVGVIVAGGSVALERSEVLGLRGGLILQSAAGPAGAEVIDTLVQAIPPISTGAPAAKLDGLVGNPATMTARGSTFVSGGIDPAITVEEISGPATVALRNSIVYHLPEEVATTDLEATGGTITASHSSFTTRVEKSGGTTTAPGSGTNVIGDPQFVDVGGRNFALQPTSALIDRGDPSIVAPGELDLAGASRSFDGDGDCVAAPDIGAFEVTGQVAQCPAATVVDLAPAVSAFGVTNRVFAPKGGKARGRRAAASGKKKRARRGTKFTYTLSEPARVTITIERRVNGRKIRRGRRTLCRTPAKSPVAKRLRCFGWLRKTALTAEQDGGAGSTPFSGRVRGRSSKPGRYRATIVATDAAGQASAPQRLTFRIVRP